MQGIIMTIEDNLILKHLSTGAGTRWELYEPFEYTTKDGYTIVVPKGYRSDGASVPRGLWNLFPVNGRYLPAAIVHDYIYTDMCSVFTKKQADQIFADIMDELDVPKWKIKLMHAGVSIGGKGGWKDNDDDDPFNLSDYRP